MLTAHFSDGASAPTIELMGARIAVLVPSEATGGAFSLVEYTTPPRFPGAPRHYHNGIDELFYVLEGRLTMTAGEERRVIGPGECVAVPRGVVHTFANETDSPARFLVQLTPGGFENYFNELAELVRKSETWPPADRSIVTAIASRYDSINV